MRKIIINRKEKKKVFPRIIHLTYYKIRRFKQIKESIMSANNATTILQKINKNIYFKNISNFLLNYLSVSKKPL